VGNGDSSSGSDSEPSEDNLEAAELVKNLPAVDKPLSLALKKTEEQKKNPTLRKDQIKKARQSSPGKDSNRERWRISSYPKSNLAKEDGEASPHPKKGQGRLPEIKEERKESASPSKVGRSEAKPGSKPKPVMVDAMTQVTKQDAAIFK
jgi:hypothetical protein